MTVEQLQGKLQNEPGFPETWEIIKKNAGDKADALDVVRQSLHRQHGGSKYVD